MRGKQNTIFLVAPVLAIVNLCTAQWVQSADPSGGTVASFAVVKGNLFAGNPSGVFRSTDSGASWTAVTNGMTATSVWALTANRGYLYAGTYDGGVFRTSNEGLTWLPVDDGLLDTHVLALRTDGLYLYAGTPSGIFRSADDGATWTSASSGLTNLYVRALACREGEIFAGTLGGGVQMTSDSGVNWKPMNAGLGDVSVMSIAFCDSQIYAGTYEGLFLSTNGARNWMKINPRGANPLPRAAAGNDLLEPKTVYTLAASGRRIFVGMFTDGVYSSSDGGANWRPINSGLTNLSVYSIFAGSSYLYVGLYGGGVGRCALTDIVTSDPGGSPGMTESITLAENYPNPFNPKTIIRFQLPVESPAGARHAVRLLVYDLLGREVAMLVNGPLTPGSYAQEFNADGLASGVYLYRLTVGDWSEVKKMVLLR